MVFIYIVNMLLGKGEKNLIMILMSMMIQGFLKLLVLRRTFLTCSLQFSTKIHDDRIQILDLILHDGDEVFSLNACARKLRFRIHTYGFDCVHWRRGKTKTEIEILVSPNNTEHRELTRDLRG